MITLTENAIKRLKEIAEEDNLSHLNVRVGLKGGGCAGFQYDMFFEDREISDVDQVFEFGDIKIIVDPVSFEYIDDTEIDYVETMVASGFKFNNTKITGSCGCGKSVAF